MLLALTALIALSALAPALSAAAITNVPGATEGDQYFEEVPNGGGSSGVNQGGGGGSSTGQPVAGTQALDQLGSDGKAAAALANANRPPENGKTGGNKAGGNNGAHASQTGSPTDGVGGMGFWFPLLIAGTAVAAIAYGLRRRLYPT